MNLYAFPTQSDADLAVDNIDAVMQFDGVTVSWDIPAEGYVDGDTIWTVQIPAEWKAANPGVLDDSAWAQVDAADVTRPIIEEPEP